MFARPEKDNRPHIFGLLNVRDGKSLVLEVSVESSEVKEEWISALKAANITYNSPKKNSRSADGDIAGGASNDEVFCGGFSKGGQRGKDEKDCVCTIS